VQTCHDAITVTNITRHATDITVKRTMVCTCGTVCTVYTASVATVVAVVVGTASAVLDGGWVVVVVVVVVM
jgi:hypothetical protein